MTTPNWEQVFDEQIQDTPQIKAVIKAFIQAAITSEKQKDRAELREAVEKLLKRDKTKACYLSPTSDCQLEHVGYEDAIIDVRNLFSEDV